MPVRRQRAVTGEAVKLAFLLTMPALAGCLQADMAGPFSQTAMTLPAAAEPTFRTVVFLGCTGHLGFVPWSWENAEQAMPQGFGPDPYPSGDPALHGRLASLTLEARVCPEMIADGASLGPATWFLVAAHVVPPQQYREDRFRAYVLLRVWTEHEALGSILRSWSIGDVADLSVSLTGQQGAAVTGLAEAKVGGTTVRLRTAVPGPLARFGEAFGERAFGIVDGKVASVIDFHSYDFEGAGFTKGGPLWVPHSAAVPEFSGEPFAWSTALPGIGGYAEWGDGNPSYAWTYGSRQEVRD